MAHISFTTTLFKIGSWTILKLPESASAKLPSRGQAMVNATINGHTFVTPLEPDGMNSHWLRVEPTVRKAAHIAAGDNVSVTMTVIPNKEWPEPPVPKDFMDAILADSKAHDVWQHATPMAHWEWVRWLRATNRLETHNRRIVVGCSKMRSGERRPCCWNRNACSEPRVSKNGVLLEPTA